MVTLRQVAERAGVSIKTVSRIVNGDPAVNAKTRDSVQVHLQSLNYIPNQAARLMRGGQSSVYGLMTDAVATTWPLRSVVLMSMSPLPPRRCVR